MAEPGYSLTACMEEHLAARAGCRLDWADIGQGGDHAPCSTWDQIFRYQTSLTAVRSEELLDEYVRKQMIQIISINFEIQCCFQ